MQQVLLVEESAERPTRLVVLSVVDREVIAWVVSLVRQGLQALLVWQE